MKLLRVGTTGAERPALLDAEGVLRDLSGVVPDIDGALLADDAALGRIRTAAEAGELPVLDADGLRVEARDVKRCLPSCVCHGNERGSALERKKICSGESSYAK